jgi:F-type H+-transporting ATPase subunit c
MKKLTLRFAAFVSTMLVTASALAQNETDSATMSAAYIAAGLGIGIAAAGGALGQGRASAAALEGIARNPNASDKLFVPMILGLALIESLVIYALVISLILVFK